MLLYIIYILIFKILPTEALLLTDKMMVAGQRQSPFAPLMGKIRFIRVVLCNAWTTNPKPFSILRTAASCTVVRITTLHLIEHHVMKDAACDKYLLTCQHASESESIIEYPPSLLQYPKYAFNIFSNTLEVRREASLKRSLGSTFKWTD